jgi:hypothetical protein
MSSGTRRGAVQVAARGARVVFIRTGWMVCYHYGREHHAPLGGGSFNNDNVGSEVNNFRDRNGRLHGYVQTGSTRGGFNLPRVAPTTAESLNDVLVIAYATAPDRPGQRIVGWYRAATCHAEEQGNRPGGLYGIWNFEAPTEMATLLPLAERRLVAPPREDGGFGTALVRYARDDDGRPLLHPWMRDAIGFVRSYRGGNLLRGDDPGELPAAGARSGQGFTLDALARDAIESHAMKLAIRFFRARGYEVDADVHRYQPYDLLCTLGSGEAMRVEVKGTTTEGETVLLTAGEVGSARRTDIPTTLFVVSGIEVTQRAGRWRARGGDAAWLPRWSPVDRALAPLTYRYRLPQLRPLPRAR